MIEILTLLVLFLTVFDTSNVNQEEEEDIEEKTNLPLQIQHALKE